MSFEKFFNPRSLAIIGASREKGKVGYEILKNLIQGGYPGRIYPVNPKAALIEGLKSYPDVTSIEETPDLAIIVIPAKFVPAAMQDCVAKGIKAVVIITAGFKETGEEGKKLEEEVIRIAKTGGVRVIGPNCLGVMVPSSKLNGSFGGDLPVPGGISFISQSGALMAAILDMANANGIGFSKLVSIGNKADVSELDLIKALGSDAQTHVITGYLENIVEGAAFVQEAEQISREKPILLMKSGGTAAGARAASSHTGSLAGGEAVYEAAFERAGIIRCRSIKNQFDFAQAMAYQPLPKGPRVVVVTNAGGPGIMAADAIEREGLTFAQLSDDTKRKLAARLPAAANIHNPVDVLGDALADRYEFAIDTVLDDPNVDTVLVLLTPQAMTQCPETAAAMVRVSKAKPGKQMLACFMGAMKIADALRVLREGRIPQYDSPESAARTIKVIADYVVWRNKPPRVIKRFRVEQGAAAQVIDEYLRASNREIGEADAKRVMEAYGFTTPKAAMAATADEAIRAAQRIGFPVVMKIVSPEILHKSDVGGVKLGLGTAEQVAEAFTTMMREIPKKKPGAKLVGVSIQETCKRGQEVILGMSRDPRFGPMIMFGLGGILVEVLKDVSFALAPLTEEDARQMMARTRTYAILKGVRGQPGVDLDLLAEALLRVSQLVTDFPQIQELDVNPFVVGPAGQTPVAVDARMSVAAT